MNAGWFLEALYYVGIAIAAGSLLCSFILAIAVGVVYIIKLRRDKGW